MKVAANSMLYAVYICLIVAVLCGALLSFANLYGQLNLFYNTREDLYIRNQSDLNFALENFSGEDLEISGDSSGVASLASLHFHGVLPVLRLMTFTGKDTVISVHFVGRDDHRQFCLYVSNFSKPLKYAGNVTLIGDKELPGEQLSQEYLNNLNGKFVSSGNIRLSKMGLEAVNPGFKEVYEKTFAKGISLDRLLQENDSLRYNSFLEETIVVTLEKTRLDHAALRGNFILQARDSLVIGKNARLEDVIVKADKVYIEDGFTGNLQVFARKILRVGSDVKLGYPSALCLYSEASDATKIEVGSGTTIYGAVILFGNSIAEVDKNEMILEEKTLVVGDVYCSDRLMPAGRIFGSAYANRIFYKTGFSQLENCIINAEIDASRKPDYFISVPLFKDNDNKGYDICKKVF